MNAEALQQYLHEHIPLSRAMQVGVLAASPAEVRLIAPLAPNINHRDTAFGGSLSTLAILSAWSLLHLRLLDAGLVARLVIQSNRMQYDAAIDGSFTATAKAPEPDAWAAFVRMFQRKGVARIAVASRVEQPSAHGAARPGGRFEGEFVAMQLVESNGSS